MLKAWHLHGNTLPGAADFYPLLLKVGKDSIKWKNGARASRTWLSVVRAVHSRSLRVPFRMPLDPGEIDREGGPLAQRILYQDGPQPRADFVTL